MAIHNIISCMSQNPYYSTYLRQQQRRPISRMVWGIPIFGMLVVLYYSRDIATTISNTAFLEQIVFRLALLLFSGCTLVSYQDIIRSDDRNVYSIHPIQSRQLLASLLRQHISTTWVYPLLAWWVLVPIYLQIGAVPLEIDRVVFAVGNAVLLGATWLAGLGMGYAVNLLAIWMSQSPMFSEMLDLIRGQNPREQASFIYAPGLALAVVGVGLALGSAALLRLATGHTDTMLYVYVSIPFLLAVLGYLVAWGLVEQYLWRANVIIADIDAHWSVVEQKQRQEDGRVYLQHLAGSNVHILRVLRQAWRDFRWYTWFAWGSGLLSMWMWTNNQQGNVAIISFVSLLVLGMLPLRWTKQDPQWLDFALGLEYAVLIRARVIVSLLLSAGHFLPVGLGILYGSGVAKGLLLFLGLLLCAVIPSVFAGYVSRELYQHATSVDRSAMEIYSSVRSKYVLGVGGIVFILMNAIRYIGGL